MSQGTEGKDSDECIDPFLCRRNLLLQNSNLRCIIGFQRRVIQSNIDPACRQPLAQFSQLLSILVQHRYARIGFISFGRINVVAASMVSNTKSKATLLPQ